jgi:hypothetical protein
VIYLVCTPDGRGTIARLIRGTPGLQLTLRPVTYDELFARREASIAHYIFTDHDLLPPSTLERAARCADAAAATDPAARILNHPLRALERYALVRRLAQLGIGAFDMVRLDEGRLPRFPAFIRCESGTGRPETQLLHNEDDYVRALSALDASGRSRKGRVAVEYVDVRSRDGRYRKFGAVRIGDRIVPQHLFVADDWCVKLEDARFDAGIAAEELAFVRGTPPVAGLMDVFEAAGIEYGRMDYALVDGRPVVFEINTNPSMPRPGGGDLRAARRTEVCRQLAEAFRALDRPMTRDGTFPLPRASRTPASATVIWRRLRAAASQTRMADAYFRWRRNRRLPPAPVGDIAGGHTNANHLV